MKLVLSFTLILCIGPLVVGCPKRPTTVPTPADGQAVAVGASTGASGTDGGKANAMPGPTAADSGLLGQATIYFDFDQSDIKPEFTALIVAHGRRLADNRQTRVRLEGNTEERGSAEYNIGLGERRAQAVMRALILQGAVDRELVTISYGEERPAAEGHDGAAWARNRRVDIVYLAGQ